MGILYINVTNVSVDPNNPPGNSLDVGISGGFIKADATGQNISSSLALVVPFASPKALNKAIIKAAVSYVNSTYSTSFVERDVILFGGAR